MVGFICFETKWGAGYVYNTVRCIWLVMMPLLYTCLQMNKRLARFTRCSSPSSLHRMTMTELQQSQFKCTGKSIQQTKLTRLFVNPWIIPKLSTLLLLPSTIMWITAFIQSDWIVLSPSSKISWWPWISLCWRCTRTFTLHMSSNCWRLTVTLSLSTTV